MAISILFNMINVNAQQTNTTVSVGEVLQSGWSAHSKTNTAQNGLVGINNTLLFSGYIIDNDVVDAPINDNDITTSGQGQTA